MCSNLYVCLYSTKSNRSLICKSKVRVLCQSWKLCFGWGHANRRDVVDGSYFVEGFPLGYVKECQQLLLISQNISGYCMAGPNSRVFMPNWTLLAHWAHFISKTDGERPEIFSVFSLPVSEWNQQSISCPEDLYFNRMLNRLERTALRKHEFNNNPYSILTLTLTLICGVEWK